jgi:PHP family Zn ribbon phosphoesterase
MVLKADFHLHSCLSPCGDLEMSPSLIARTLRERGVTLAALTDHNSALNCPAFAIACAREGIAPLFGMEAQTAEEVHMLCLFSHLDTALMFGEELYAMLPPIMNIPEKMGDQVYVNEDDEILGEVEKYLVVSVEYDVFALATRVHKLGGLVIPAHADRQAFSLTSQLGYIPDGDWDAIEMVSLPNANAAENKMPLPEGNLRSQTLARRSVPNKPVIQCSDAHYVEHIARRFFTLDTGDEAIQKQNGETDLDVVRRALQKLL